ATEDTQVWVFFDSDQLYVGLRALDSRPDRMVANEMRRDNRNIWQNDNVIVLLDTFLDRRTAFFFQTNPLGGVRDALVLNESTTNYDWNTVWDVRSRRTDEGWTVEMAIPFKSLRYRPGSEQLWGFNVMRVLRSINEQSLLSPVPDNSGQGMRMASAATLVGIEAPTGSRNIELRPYAISDLTTNVPAGISNELDADFGIDARYGVTSSMTFDLTYNTDFAQVEIDEQQVNLTRFGLFLPEKREFFLEGQGIFDFAGSGGGRGFGGQSSPLPHVFFSRRIGLDEGTPVPIRAGGRLMGRVGRMSMGALNIQTADAPIANAEATNFSVVRIKSDVLRRSSIGAILTNRNPSPAGGKSGRAYGADANLLFYDNLQLNAFYARTSEADPGGDPESYRAQLNYDSDRYGLQGELLKVGDAFDPDVGFLLRDDFLRTFASARFSPRPTSSRYVRRLSWEASFDRFVNGADVVETRQEKASFNVELDSSDQVTLALSRNLEFLDEPFDVADDVVVPAGEHRFSEATLSLQLGPQRKVSGMLTASRGGFFDGDRTGISYNGRVELSPRLSLEPRVSFDWISRPDAKTRVTLLGARPTLTITPRMYVGALVQYNSSSGALETNVRWRWEFEPGSDLFVVYTDGRDTTARGFSRLVSRGLAIKLTRFFRF
ncbi:MAG TPA: DUF5916 domain-containing protein, partial [Longimicrobiales bacterium]|nr:DUF5916 domain-containing protein [Longimicrobiales bacterium]